MSANVRCAGGGNAQWNLGKGRGVAEPCGWKGERFGIGDADLWDDPDIRDARIDRARTAKPCPWCKGRIELIPQEATP